MEIQKKFNVILYREAHEFLARLDDKTRRKIYQTFDRASLLLDAEVFKKLADTDIWEFRIYYNKKKYRILAFWDKTKEIDILVIATHGFVKKTQKTPQKKLTKHFQSEISILKINKKRYEQERFHNIRRI